MNTGLAVAGIAFLIIGLLILIYGLTTAYLCPAQFYENGQLVGGCGSTPTVIPAFGTAFMIIGAILLVLSVKNPFGKKLARPALTGKPVK
jgi:hypothetical protein